MKRKSNLIRLVEYAGKHRMLFFFGCFLSGLSAILAMFPYICIWFVAREAFRLHEENHLIGWAWMAVTFAGISALLYFISLMCTHLAAFRTARNLRSVALRHIVGLPLGFFAVNESGRLRKQIHDNADLTETLLAHQLPDFIGAITAPAAAIILLFVFDWRMGLACLLPMIAAALLLFRMLNNCNGKFFTLYQQKLEEMSGEAVEYVRGIPVLKVFQQSIYSFRNFHLIIQEYRDHANNYAMSQRTSMTLFTTFLNATFVLLIPAGMLLIATNGNSGTSLLFDFLFYLFFAPACAMMLTRVMYCSEAVLQAGEAVRKLDWILEQKPLPEPVCPEIPAKNEIQFDRVTFQYDENGIPALSDVSFSAANGTTTAMVGRSGGGKTTAAMLLPRFRDVTSGAIRIGGIDVRQIPSSELMKRISFVFQDTHLFQGSILENIRCSKPDASPEQIHAAVKAARCEEILARLPAGIDTVLGTKGTYLSGGEMQRIALARAILKDAPIIVLDEATAFADPENEHLIREALSVLTKGKTVLTIFHRLSNIVPTDNILVFDHGTIAERGKHDELLRQNGIYAELWKEYHTTIEWKTEREARQC